MNRHRLSRQIDAKRAKNAYAICVPIPTEHSFLHTTFAGWVHSKKSVSFSPQFWCLLRVHRPGIWVHHQSELCLRPERGLPDGTRGHGHRRHVHGGEVQQRCEGKKKEKMMVLRRAKYGRQTIQPLLITIQLRLLFHLNRKKILGKHTVL